MRKESEDKHICRGEMVLEVPHIVAETEVCTIIGFPVRSRSHHDDIPLELWREILSYLPSKSLLRFRLVSKAWRSIIEDSRFASLHLRHCSSNLQSNLHLLLRESMVYNRRIRSRWVIRPNVALDQVALKIEAPLGGMTTWEIAGSVNGLILFRRICLPMWKAKDDVFLWNPSIRKTLCIPPPPCLPQNVDLENYPSFDILLGFDQSINDYKVVTMVHHLYDVTPEPIPKPKVEIFTLQSRSWRSVVGSGGAQCVLRANEEKVFAAERVNWIGRDYSPIIYPPSSLFLVSFDVASEMFSYTPIMPYRHEELLVPFALDGSYLAVARKGNQRSPPSSIWVFETSKSGWSEKREINLEHNCKCLYVKKRGILVCGEEISYIYDPDSKTQEKVVLDPRCVRNVDIYVENLVLLT